MQLPTHLLHSNKPAFACRISGFNQYIELDLLRDFVDVICLHLKDSPPLTKISFWNLVTKMMSKIHFWLYMYIVAFQKDLAFYLGVRIDIICVSSVRISVLILFERLNF